MASSGIITVLKVHRAQEAAVNSQAKLRRVSEVVSQEIRGAVLGGIMNQPYASTATSISFALLDGGAGYPVQSLTSSSVDIVSNTAPDLAGKNVLMINKDGEAIMMGINTVQSLGSSWYRLIHGSCSNALSATTNMLLFKVNNVGFSYDHATDVLNYQLDGQTFAAAFNITDFRLDYVYTQTDGTPVVQPAPLVIGAAPQKKGVIAGNDVELSRLQLVLSTQARTSGSKTLERTYSSQIDLASSASDAGASANLARVKGVLSCN
jgi:hypothetical protein